MTNHWHVSQHTLEKDAAAVRQLSNETYGDDLYIRIATVGNTIQTLLLPHSNISGICNAAKL